MVDFKTEIRVLMAAVVAFVAAYSINSFFNSILEDCSNPQNTIRARFWYMLFVTGVTIAVIFVLVEYGEPDDSDDEDDDDNEDESDGDRSLNKKTKKVKTMKERSEFGSSTLRRKLLR